jgi:hypothetical protein
MCPSGLFASQYNVAVQQAIITLNSYLSLTLRTLQEGLVYEKYMLLCLGRYFVCISSN